jgi:hypothetical protein
VLGMHGDGAMESGDPSWRRSPWVQALVTYRLDVEADELDNWAKHHHTDFDMRVEIHHGPGEQGEASSWVILPRWQAFLESAAAKRILELRLD